MAGASGAGATWIKDKGRGRDGLRIGSQGGEGIKAKSYISTLGRGKGCFQAGRFTDWQTGRQGEKVVS